MNSASRLHDVIIGIYEYPSLENRTQIKYFSALKSIFSCNDVFSVYDNLKAVHSETTRLESESARIGISQPMRKAISTIKSITSPTNIDTPIDNIKQNIAGTNTIVSLEFAKSMLDSDEIKDSYLYKEDEVDIGEFSKKLDELIDEIGNASFDDNDKEIFISFLYDLKKGAILYRINGIDALVRALQNSICKYKLIKGDVPSKYKNIKEKVSFIIGEIYFLATAAKKAKGGYKLLKESVSGIIDTEVQESD